MAKSEVKTKKEIANLKKHLIAAFGDDKDNKVTKSFFWDDFSMDESSYDSENQANFKKHLNNLGISVKSEDHYGGEGQGEDYWTVYSFTDGKETVYIKFDGWYQSYNGSEYNEWFFVEPREVKVVQYFKV